MVNRFSHDRPKLLADQREREARHGQLYEPHVAPLNRFVEALRARAGADGAVPYFDPWDGGIDAEVLYLLEAPGAKAVVSGFVSRNNPDETAKNFFELNATAGLPREKTITWNIVPWYIGNGTRIRPANGADIQEGFVPLQGLLSLLPRLRAIVFVGQKAAAARSIVEQRYPKLRLFYTPHPSPLFVNNKPGNRERILVVLRDVATFIMHFDSAV